jgi:hypothetical protein
MGSELITKFWLHESQSKKTPIIFHTTYYLCHNQLSQLHIFWEVRCQYSKYCHKTPHLHWKIGVKRWHHTCCCIGLDCELEHVLLKIKVINIQHLKNLCFMAINDLIFFIQDVVLITTSCLANDASHSNYSQY